MNIFRIEKIVVLFFYDQKLILGIDFFVRQSRGVLNTPHMYTDF